MGSYDKFRSTPKAPITTSRPPSALQDSQQSAQRTTGVVEGQSLRYFEQKASNQYSWSCSAMLTAQFYSNHDFNAQSKHGHRHEELLRDLKLFVGPNRKRYDVHRNIMSRSDFIRRACLGNFKEAKTHEIELPEISGEHMDILLAFIYTDRLEWSNIAKEGFDIGGLYQSANYLCLDGFTGILLAKCTKHMEQYPGDCPPPLVTIQETYDATRKIHACTTKSEHVALKPFFENIFETAPCDWLEENLAESQDPFDIELKKYIFRSLDCCLCNKCEPLVRAYSYCTRCGEIK